MKKLYILSAFAFLFCIKTNAQNLIINGSFENNTAAVNSTDLTAASASTVSDSYEVDGGSMDLITSNPCGTASDGSWFVTTSPGSGMQPYLAFTLKLSSPLTIGTAYVLHFDDRYCGPNSSPVDVGITDDSTMMGTAVHSFPATFSGAWTTESYAFTATVAAHYLSVNVGVLGNTGGVGLDNFILTVAPVGIKENENPLSVSVFPNPSDGIFTFTNNIYADESIVITDVLGNTIFQSLITNCKFTIDLSKESKGIYFYKLSDKSGIVITGKLIIE